MSREIPSLSISTSTSTQQRYGTQSILELLYYTQGLMKSHVHSLGEMWIIIGDDIGQIKTEDSGPGGYLRVYYSDFLNDHATTETL